MTTCPIEPIRESFFGAYIIGGDEDEDKVWGEIVGEELLQEAIEHNNKIREENESFTQGYTMYTGISLKQWDNVWKNKNLTDRETNVTDDKFFAFNYSYDFKTGKYDDVIVEISNIPLDAFVAYRALNTGDDYYDGENQEEAYADDDDFHTMNGMSNDEKKNIIDSYSLFLVSLYKYKDIISTKLLKRFR